jgi:3-deoxy-D-manno-octulosonic-acid transferase
VVYFLYNAILTAGFVLALPFLPLLWFLGERFRTGLFQRLGWYSQPVKNELAAARPVWIHAASVGEIICAARLAQELKKRSPQPKIIVSTFTSAGNRFARQASAADLVIFLPFDLLWTVRRALRVFNPSLLVVLETEIWPNLIRELYRRGIPCVLLSGRISTRAFPRYFRLRSFFRKVIEKFTVMGMQTEEDARRAIALGGRPERVAVTGSLKRATPERDAHAGRRFNGKTPGARHKPILVVGSSHRGEEEILLEVFVSLKNRYPDLQMVLAPRHPQRFDEVERLLRARGMAYEKKSHSNGRLSFEKDILFLDTLGDLPDFYALGDVAFVGGSLIEAGGHNLLEPARFAKPVLFGPHTANVAAVATEMKEQGAGIEVQGGEDLIEKISTLLADPEKCRTMGERAYQIATDDPQVLENSVALACRYLQNE